MCWRVTNDLGISLDVSVSPSSLVVVWPKAPSREGLTEFTVFAFVSLHAGAHVLAEAVVTLALILARVGFALVTICSERIWKPRLKSFHRGYHWHCVVRWLCMCDTPCPLQRFSGMYYNVLVAGERGFASSAKEEDKGTMWHLFLDWVLIREGGDSLPQGLWVWNKNQGMMIQLWQGSTSLGLSLTQRRSV